MSLDRKAARARVRQWQRTTKADYCTTLTRALDELDAQDRQIAELRAALRAYGQHSIACRGGNGYGCSCGLEKFLRTPEE